MIRRPPRSTLFSLHDALPISLSHRRPSPALVTALSRLTRHCRLALPDPARRPGDPRSEEHTSELQSRLHLVCRLLLEKKKKSDKPLRSSSSSTGTSTS